MRIAILLTIVLWITSCAHDPLVGGEERVSVRLESNSIVASNESNTTYYYALINPRALMTWTICASPLCPRLEPGETRNFRYDELVGGPAAPTPDDVSLYYWRLVRRGSRYEVDRLREAKP